YGTSQPGYGTSQPGFGTGAPHGGFAPVAASTGGGGKGGLAIGIVAAVLLGGVVLVGGGIAGAIFLLDQESDDGGTQAGSIGTVRIQTDVAAGELFVDGTSRGPVVPGQVFRLSRGSHDLEIRERGAVVATSRVVITPNQEQAVAMNRTAQPPPSGGQAMMPGNVQTFTGALRPGDETLRSGEYADSYYFEWTAGTQIRLEADSNDFDTYLILKAPSGAQRDNDDREPGNLNAAMDATIQETGRWQVMVTSFSSGETGDYTLTVRGP
ncbi:MAG TPA: PPC domain-containing protein, partial [Sandaracinaceae bacterium LLY-WYZ-13_1]|nr:PPC domain-containing protein [Sandaracinaceae bacterium LLY-WYZ-13_1]